jgi:hypothetical protein
MDASQVGLWEADTAMDKQASQIQRQQNHISELQGKIARQAEALKLADKKYETAMEVLDESSKRLCRIELQLDESQQDVSRLRFELKYGLAGTPNCVPETMAVPTSVLLQPSPLWAAVDNTTIKQGTLKNVGPDAPIVTNAIGGKQSKVDYRFDLLPAKATFAVAGVLDHGAKKYEPWNWLKIEAEEHVNHALIHMFAWLEGDEQDDHMSHAACRVMMALEKSLEGK